MAAKNRNKSNVTAVSNDRVQKQMRFEDSEYSIVGNLISLENELPKSWYDPAIHGQRLDVDEQRKGNVLESLSNSSCAVTGATAAYRTHARKCQPCVLHRPRRRAAACRRSRWRRLRPEAPAMRSRRI